MGIHQGFDVCLEMSGNPEAYPLVFNHTKAEGEIVLVGILDSSAANGLALFHFQATYRERHLWQKDARDLAADGRLNKGGVRS